MIPSPATLLQIADSPRAPALSEPLRTHLRQCAAVWEEHLRLLELCRATLLRTAEREGASPAELRPFLQTPEHLTPPPAKGPAPD
jgi:hypothetical protein